MAPVSRKGASDKYLLFEPAQATTEFRKGSQDSGTLPAPTLEHSYETLRLFADRIGAVLLAGGVESDFEQFLEGVARRDADDFVPFCEFRCRFRTGDAGETGSAPAVRTGARPPARGPRAPAPPGGAGGDPLPTPARGSSNELVSLELGV